MTQVRKAKGLKKKILNPVEKERKGVLDFCYVAHGQGAIPVKEFLQLNDMDQEKCGLASIPHMHEVYGVYYGEECFKGIVRKETANDLAKSSIPKGSEPVAVMSFNKSGYSKYCKEYKEYWEWVAKRNDSRYQNSLGHGKNYDAKNMMHSIRLLTMCEEIGESGILKVRREDRDFLLRVKRGEFEYEELLKEAEQKMEQIEEVYQHSKLPEAPDLVKLTAFLLQIRHSYYGN